MSGLTMQNNLTARLMNAEKERELLSALIVDQHVRIKLIDKVTNECFTSVPRQELFKLVVAMYKESMKISYTSVKDMIGIRIGTSQLNNSKEEFSHIENTPLTDSPDNTLYIVKELYKNRVVYQEVIQDAGKMFASNEPINKIIGNIQESLLKIETGRKEVDLDKVTDNVIDEIINPAIAQKGLKTGLDLFDAQCGGIQKDRYYTIGAESGGGKTATLVDIIHRLSERYSNEIAIMFFSMEMSEERVIRRFVSRATGLTNQRLEGRIRGLSDKEKQDVESTRAKIKKYPLTIIYETLTTSQLELKARAFALKNEGKHLIYMFDHIGLVKGESENERINTIRTSIAIKNIVRDHDASCIALTQFTKEIDSAENAKNYHKPKMRYIMESGRIRQDSDTVILLWRPETRFVTINYHGDQNWNTAEKIIWLIEKNRDGAAPCDQVYECKVGSNTINNLDIQFI